MDELRKPKDEEEADVLYSALAALGNVEAPIVNFILRGQLQKVAWKVDDPPDVTPTPYYTIFRDPVGYWRTDDGRQWPVLEIKMRGKQVMLIAPELEKIVARTPTKA